MTENRTPSLAGDRERPTAWSILLNRPMQFTLDLAVLAGAFVLAYLLRFDFVLQHPQGHQIFTQLPLVLLVQFASLFLAQVYSFVWRYVGLAETAAFVKAGVGSSLALLVLRLVLPESMQQWLKSADIS